MLLNLFSSKSEKKFDVKFGAIGILNRKFYHNYMSCNNVTVSICDMTRSDNLLNVLLFQNIFLPASHKL